MIRDDHAASLAELIQSKRAKVAVIGVGYVGLPMASALIEAGFTTIGYDVDQSKISQLRGWESYIASIRSE